MLTSEQALKPSSEPASQLSGYLSKEIPEQFTHFGSEPFDAIEFFPVDVAQSPRKIQQIFCFCH
jgi:hypothetical protein